MKRTLILCLFLAMSETAGICATTFFPPLQPLQPVQQVGGNNLAQNNNNSITSLPDPFVSPANTPNTPNVNNPDISQIEQSLFGQSYVKQNISVRLSRIEKSLFTTTYPNSSVAQRIDNIISNFNQINKYPNISKNTLSKIESQVFSQNFPQNSAERRVERLEQQVFGAVQSGDLESRYEAVKMAAKSYSRNKRNNDQYFPNDMPQSGWKGLANNLGGAFFGGSMTGFTPPINPYNNYNNGYNNYSSSYSNPDPYNSNFPSSYTNSYANAYQPGCGMYRGVRTNHGYSDSFQNYSSGTGVTILD